MLVNCCIYNVLYGYGNWIYFSSLIHFTSETVSVNKTMMISGELK